MTPARVVLRTATVVLLTAATAGLIFWWPPVFILGMLFGGITASIDHALAWQDKLRRHLRTNASPYGPVRQYGHSSAPWVQRTTDESGVTAVTFAPPTAATAHAALRSAVISEERARLELADALRAAQTSRREYIESLTAPPHRAPWWRRLWQRLTPWWVVALTPLLLIPVGLLAAPPAGALTMGQHIAVTVAWSGDPHCIYAHQADTRGTGIITDTALCSDIQSYRFTSVAVPGRWVGVDPEMTGAEALSCTLWVDGVALLTSTATRGDGTEVTCLVRW